MNGPEVVSPKKDSDARLLSALQVAKDLGWIGSERGLAEELGLPPTVFYKVRNGLQSFPKEGLFELERFLGLSSSYVREGVQPPFKLPAAPDTIKRSVFDRLRHAALSLSLSVDAVSGKMGLSAAKWKMLKEGAEAKLPGLAQALSSAFPSISTAWLLLGLGVAEPLAGQSPISLASPPPPSYEPQVIYLPFVDSRARASFAASYLSGVALDHLPMQPYLSKPDMRLPKDAVLIEVEGDSMIPTLMPKDVLLIAPVPASEWRYLSGGVYTVLYGQDHLVVKRVKQNTLATEGILRLVSDNPSGGQIDLPGADISSIFRVLAITRQL